MLPREMLKSKEAKEIWDFLYANEEKKNSKTKIIIPFSKESRTPQSTNNIPVSSTSIDNLVSDKDFLSTAINNEPKEAKENKPTISNLKTVQLHDIVTYFQNRGVVGEEALVVGTYLALSNTISFGVEGYSGSGKTFLVDKLIDLVHEDDVYRAELSSKMALFYDQERVNESKIIYIPELQKALNDKSSPVTEIVKNITEGKSARRLVTSKDLAGSEEFIINKDKTIVYTLALENHFKKDNEAARRFMRFITDSSPKHFEAIHNYKANARMNIARKQDNEELTVRLSNHLNTLRKLSVQVIDPFAEYIQAFIPKTQKSVGYVDHYYHLIDACTRFHFQNREYFKVNGQDYLLTNLEDHYYVHSIYYNEFLKSLDDLAQEGEQDTIKRAIDWKACFLQGRENLYNNETLQKVMKENPTLLKNWELAQIGQGTINTKDYKTGELFVLVDNIRLKEHDTIS